VPLAARRSADLIEVVGTADAAALQRSRLGLGDQPRHRPRGHHFVTVADAVRHWNQRRSLPSASIVTYDAARPGEDVIAHVLGAAARVHCPSAALAEDAVFRGADAASLAIIPPGPGVEYILLAIRDVIDHGVRVSGSLPDSGTERQRTTFTIRDLGLDAAVDLAGRPGNAAVVGVIAAHDPSVGLAAMAKGAAVVTTRLGLADAIADGIEGYIVEPRNPPAMAAAFTRLADPAHRAALGAAAKDRVRREFTVERWRSAMLELYASVA
jgi:glycosyltransferase involved in cell wall biosynthesis